jgi:hypothetical protein
MARPAVHFVATTGLAAVQLLRTGRLAPALAPYLTGFFIDADHFFEYFRFRLTGRRDQKMVVLPLHGWEFALGLYLAERAFGRRLAQGLLLGYLLHLGIDQFTNTTTHPLTYFLSFRWRQGFPSALFDHEGESDIDWLNGSLLDLWKHLLLLGP